MYSFACKNDSGYFIFLVASVPWGWRVGWVCPQVNKFELVASDDHQMSVAGGGGYPRSMSGWGYPDM